MAAPTRSRLRAIAGLWSPDVPVAPGPCLAMLSALSASSAATHQPDPSVVLGSVDRLPGYPNDLPRTPGTSCLIADLRIDNYRELLRELELDQNLDDDELLASAWARWGFGIVDRLIGGFAVACWDSQRRTLFLARDHAGERPLHFSRSTGSGIGLAFASMPAALCALPSIGDRVDLARMARFLVAVPPEGTETFFTGVERLPPGHWLKASPAGIEIRRYWHPLNAPPIRHRRDDDYIDDFRERFDCAVGSRLAGGDIASQLSGGLDSSSVTATAARLLAPAGRLTAFTAVPLPEYDGSALPGRFGDEGPGAADVAALYSNIKHVKVIAGNRDLLAAVQRDTHLCGEPTFNPTNQLWLDAILDEMKARGLSVLLEGIGGNATISFGGLVGLSRLVQSGRWLELFRMTQVLRRGGHTSWRGAASWGSVGLVPQWIRSLFRPGMRNFDLAYSAVHPRFAAEYGLKEKALAAFYGSERSAAAVRSQLYELYDQGVANGAVAAGWQIEQRDPTLDKRILEFCFGIPVEQYLVGGQTRSLVRRAMKGRLPESILRCTTRGLQAADWYITVGAARPQLRAELTRIERSPLVREVLDTERLRSLLDTWPSSGYHLPGTSDCWHLALTRGISAGSFLAQHDPDMPQ